MARMNIEITFGLSRWLRIRRSDPARYHRLVLAARCLPMPEHLVSYRRDIKATIEAVAQTQAMLGQSKQTHEAIQRDPDRVLANALVYSFWRNNSILEKIHAGYGCPLPLKHRRITAAEEKRLLQGIASAYSFFISVLDQFDDDLEPMAWPEQVATLLQMIRSPGDWSLEEATRSIRLWANEPA